MEKLPQPCSLGVCLALWFALPGFPLAATQVDPQGKPPPVLSLPVDCRIGVDCFIQSHVDHDSGPGARDFKCGVLSYDGHKGVDFRIPDLAHMRRGVAVLAAAPGKVIATRDGMPDENMRDIAPETIKSRECGNGVVIDHGGGWRTQYCHLRQGSVSVARDQQVTSGQAIALAGLSGQTEFPHLHLSVSHDGAQIDPFTGTTMRDGCETPVKAPLWDPAIAPAYQPSGVVNAGFAAAPVSMQQVEKGIASRHTVPGDAPNIVYWVRIFGLLPGDQWTQKISLPDGGILAESGKTWDQNAKAQWLNYIGRKRSNGKWPPGKYSGEFQLIREGRIAVRDQRVLLVN